MTFALVWFRRDLRLDDNPALQAALAVGHVPVPVYVRAPEEEGAWRAGPASEAWLHRSLAALDASLRARGSRLLLRQGPALPTLQALAAETGAAAVYWNRGYEPAGIARDAAIKRALRGQGLDVASFNATLLFEPWTLATGRGAPYRVFTPFWRSARARLALPAPWQAPAVFPSLPEDLRGAPLADLGLRPRPAWDAGFWAHWQPGEAGAQALLDAFLEGALRGYREQRDLPDRTGTSRLSPHLHFGEIAPWRCAQAVLSLRDAGAEADAEAWLRQLGWREFAHHLLYHFPDTAERNLDPRFDAFPWAAADPAVLAAWRHGRTGIPIVDAGMRELWATGWMHNRVRMIVASFLCKHLRVHWHEGARWFWETLVDADLANNTLGWQWVAGTGADAAPYFRIFNPVTQSRRFDPQARYLARWLPELAQLPPAQRHAPWESATAAAMAARAGYPPPLVDLAAGRDAALAAWRGLPTAVRTS
ncbi:cryptochrome/photolyase family protein [Xanthomonas massiliensis]|jgi:deoxyribodipyrimidine photo-lyase|uniref:cryptochrome/photolyase family protein n=1 Tax=Xanthomonas massiliensis TaxID=1720302 RepID=UPI0008247EAE|nr:deoxyribodipyrimidine photo-lyase [Xanthomonas massiliensis]